MPENETSTPNEILPPTPRRESTARRVFIGPRGLRAGWRLALFILILMGLAFAIRMVLQAVGLFPQRKLLVSLTPGQVAASAGFGFLLTVVVTFIMSKIEGRKFGAYGLPFNQAFRKDFWLGILWGFLATSGTLLAIYVFHGVHLTRSTVPGNAIPLAVAAWTGAFLMVGFNEEFLFRGYPQFTLTTGMGFWPAAILFSALFGLGHAGNSGENVFGETSVVVFGLLFCLFLRRMGNLWFPVGFHLGYDWGQTFFYGVPDSGLLPTHNLFAASFSGPRWLTGGTVGPEASVFCPIALVIVGILFHFRYREVRYRTLDS